MGRRISDKKRRIVAGILATLIFIPAATVTAGYLTYQALPVDKLPAERPAPDEGSSKVYAADGSFIGEFRTANSYSAVKSDEISTNMKIAAVASEDHNFYNHSGVDFHGVVRAFKTNLTQGSVNQGGSTITQQLAKILYTNKERSAARKVRELFIAKQLEKTYSKDEILTKYLNTVYMGDSTYGVEAASQSYFRKPAKDLTLSEAALLAGVLPAPSEYSPRSHPDKAEERRNEVLDKILKYHMAPKEQVDAARAEKPIVQGVPDVAGRYPYFMDYVRVYLLEVVGLDPELLYHGGLRIETTLDPRLQERAQQVINTTLPDPKDPDAAMVSIEPSTGFVRVLVGGKGWEQNKVNLALGKLGGGSGRQAGSSFKPFVLARAYEMGISPNKKYTAPSSITPPGFKKPVGNYEGGTFGVLDLNTAMAKSANTVFVQLIVDVGIQQTGELAKRLGITSLDPSKPIYGSIAIGAYEVSPLDMASAYGVFANRGLREEPTPIVKVTYQDQTIIDNSKRAPVQVLDQIVADNVTKTLTGVVQRGTGTAANIGRPVAGKTGTSDAYQNAWFVGYTPQLVTSVWMGYKDENNKSMYNVHGVARVTGGSHPARMWKAFMQTAMEGVPVQGFPEPAPIVPGKR